MAEMRKGAAEEAVAHSAGKGAEVQEAERGAMRRSCASAVEEAARWRRGEVVARPASRVWMRVLRCMAVCCIWNASQVVNLRVGDETRASGTAEGLGGLKTYNESKARIKGE